MKVFSVAFMCLYVVAAKQSALPDVREVESTAGRRVDISCSAAPKDAAIVWKVGYQEVKNGINAEKWQDIARDNINTNATAIMFNPARIEDRGNYKCSYNITSTRNITNPTTNTTEQKIQTFLRSDYYRLRVRDPIGAVWPTVGILVEALVLFVVISAFEYINNKKSKSA